MHYIISNSNPEQEPAIKKDIFVMENLGNGNVCCFKVLGFVNLAAVVESFDYSSGRIPLFAE